MRTLIFRYLEILGCFYHFWLKVPLVCCNVFPVPAEHTFCVTVYQKLKLNYCALT